MRVIDNDRSEPTLARIALNSVKDTQPHSEGGKFIPGEPQNTIRFQIADPDVADLFVAGQDYYIDFTSTFQEVGSNEDAEGASVAKRTRDWNR